MNELASLLRAANTQAMRGVNTCLPGVVVSYDAGSQSATVRPTLKLRQPDGREEAMPIINNVPVVWPRSGGASMTFPVTAGDGCLLVFTQRSIDEYKASGGTVVPTDTRAFDLSDAVALMGLVPFANGGGPDDAIQLKIGGTTMLLKKDGIEITADSVKIDSAVEITGSLKVTGAMDFGSVTGTINFGAGSVTHDGVNIGKTHVHGGIATGGANTQVPH